MDEENKEENEEENKEEMKESPVVSVENPVKKTNITEKMRENPWVISTFILGVLVVILLVTTFSGTLTGNAVSEDTASNNLINYAKLQGIDVLVNSVSEESGLYSLDVSIDGQDTSLYLTKDGKNIVNGLIPMITESDSSNTDTQTTEVPKTEKPSVELYLMSFCPYGNEAEKTMEPVYSLLKDKVDWKIHFIVSVSGSTVNSLHGQPEATEDEREACVIKNYGVETWFKFANYVNNNCGSNGSCWQDAAKIANVDVNSINSCVTSSGLDLMKAEEAASNAAGANGSPTLIINGVESNSVYQYGNSEVYKGAICEAFTNVPTECSQKLSSTSTSASGSC